MKSVHDREPELLADTTVVIACPGGGADLVRELTESVRLGARHVVVDLGDAAMVDSSTLTALKRVAGRLRGRGGRLSVVCVHPGLTSVLNLTLLSQSFHVFGSLDAALRTA